MASKSFSTQRPNIPHLSKGEVGDLRSDVEAAFTACEARANFPRIDLLTADDMSAIGPDGPGLLASGPQVTVTYSVFGANLGTDAAVCRAYAGAGGPTPVEFNVTMATGTAIVFEVTTAAAAEFMAVLGTGAAPLGKLNLYIEVAGVQAAPMTITVF